MSERDLAEWLERLTASAKVLTIFNPCILRHTGILVAADEAVLTIAYKNPGRK
jgi:hypothetical protein